MMYGVWYGSETCKTWCQCVCCGKGNKLINLTINEAFRAKDKHWPYWSDVIVKQYKENNNETTV